MPKEPNFSNGQTITYFSNYIHTCTLVALKLLGIAW